mgnify:CR=1 FL=1
MENILMVILSSTVISAIITTILTFVTNKRKDTVENIIKERKIWRDELYISLWHAGGKWQYGFVCRGAKYTFFDGGGILEHIYACGFDMGSGATYNSGCPVYRKLYRRAVSVLHSDVDADCRLRAGRRDDSGGYCRKFFLWYLFYAAIDRAVGDPVLLPGQEERLWRRSFLNSAGYARDI